MHETFHGTFLGEKKVASEPASFTKVASAAMLANIDPGQKQVYVVPSLNADFFLLFPTAEAIVTAAGSPLSHLAILAREHGIPVFKAENLAFAELPESGRCQLVEKP